MQYKILSEQYGWMTSASTIEEAIRKAINIKVKSPAGVKVLVWENAGTPNQTKVYEIQPLVDNQEGK